MNKLLNNKPANEDKKKKLTDREQNYKITFSTPTGKEVVEDLKRVLGHGKTLYHLNQSNGDLHFELGRQSVINDILFILNKEAK